MVGSSDAAWDSTTEPQWVDNWASMMVSWKAWRWVDQKVVESVDHWAVSKESQSAQRMALQKVLWTDAQKAAHWGHSKAASMETHSAESLVGKTVDSREAQWAEIRDFESDSQKAGRWAESKAGKLAGLMGS